MQYLNVTHFLEIQLFVVNSLYFEFFIYLLDGKGNKFSPDLSFRRH